MNCNYIYVVSLALVLNCVISVAKNSEEKEKVSKLSLNATSEKSTVQQQQPTPEIFAEGGNASPKSRIVGRKGAVPEIVVPDYSTPSTTTTANVTQSTNKNNTSVIPTSANSATIATNAAKNSTTHRTTQKIISTTTKKPIRKPTITYSADDNPEIIASEKNINYNATTKSDDITVPKTSEDRDRTLIDEEKKTRNSYVFFMGFLFGIPMTFTLVHILYKKIKAWREIRHYQRVVSSKKLSIPQHNFNIFPLFLGFLNRRHVHQLERTK
jgi:hypothetical protein